VGKGKKLISGEFGPTTAVNSLIGTNRIEKNNALCFPFRFGGLKVIHEMQD